MEKCHGVNSFLPSPRREYGDSTTAIIHSRGFGVLMAADPSTIVQVIELTPSGEGHTTVNLGNTVVGLVTRYNYSAQCWTMDILDSSGNAILTGLMLVPGIDILDSYQEEKKTLGGMVLAEKNVGDYQDSNLLGINTKLLWFPVGTDVVIP